MTATFQPNRVAQQIIRQLEGLAFIVKVPDAPHGASWELKLENGRWFGVLYVSRIKGRALRIVLTWQPQDQPAATRRAEGTRAIRALLGLVRKWGWDQ